MVGQEETSVLLKTDPDFEVVADVKQETADPLQEESASYAEVFQSEPGSLDTQGSPEGTKPKPGYIKRRHRRKKRLTLSPPSYSSYRCEQCSAVFRRNTQLKYHMKVHDVEDKEKHRCEMCNIVFTRANKLARHQQTTHENGLCCPHCLTSFTHLNSYRLHMRIHTGEKPYECNECGATFVQSSHLSIHKRSHTGEKPYQCDVCKQFFKQISHLRTHERIHTQDRPYCCSDCGSCFIQKSSLNRHMRTHTGERPYVCSVCKRAFCVKNNLTRHMIMHTGIQPYHCDICPASFGQSVDLKRHKISHSGLKPFQCDECPAAFSRKNNLKWHKNTHSGNTPFKCQECPCEFTRPRDLKKHSLQHDVSAAHKCEVCFMRFIHAGALKRHMMSHMGEKPFECRLCPATFVDKTALTRHFQKHNAVQDYTCKLCNIQFKVCEDFRNHCCEMHGIGDTLKHVMSCANQKEESSTVVGDSQSNGALEPPDSQVSGYTVPAAVSVLSPVSAALQMPTLMLSSGPGQPARAAKPASDCQNHGAHVLTVNGNQQWQVWCFCDSADNSSAGQTVMAAGIPVASAPEGTTTAGVASVAPTPIYAAVTATVIAPSTHSSCNLDLQPNGVLTMGSTHASQGSDFLQHQVQDAQLQLSHQPQQVVAEAVQSFAVPIKGCQIQQVQLSLGESHHSKTAEQVEWLPANWSQQK